MTSKPTSSEWVKQWCQYIIQPWKRYQSNCVGCLSLLQLSFEEGKRNCCGPLSTTLGILLSTTLVCWSQKRAQHQLLVARVVALPDTELVLVRMANLTSVSATLYREMRIGDFWPPGEACTGKPATRRYWNLQGWLKYYTLDRSHQVQMRLNMEQASWVWTPKTLMPHSSRS